MFEQANFLMWWPKEVPSDNELKIIKELSSKH